MSFMLVNQSAGRNLPLVLRLTGCWLLWSAWCSLSGWGLSAINQLSSWGQLALLPVLFGAIWIWWKSTASVQNSFPSLIKWRRRLSQPLPLIYCIIAGLSLLAALVNSNPWSFDASTYRLPRLLYWWWAHHWYWIGTLDHRLDTSSTGFEWQMLPIIELTHSLQFLFLLNWIPFLLFPGLMFLAFRVLGINGRSARRWMWLMPSGYCYALQCSGLQNDGYAVDYLLGAIAFAGFAFRSRQPGGLWFAILAIGLLTNAKVSNLPLVLPLGVMLLPVLGRVSWFNWRLIVVGFASVVCSFVPLAFLCWQNTGDWMGDPTDQWHIKTHGMVAGMEANLVLLVKDSAQLPILPGNQHINAALEGLNHSAYFDWLRRSHGQFNGVSLGEMPYEGPAGAGFGLAVYVVFLLMGLWLVQGRPSSYALAAKSVPWAWRLVPWLAWIAYAVYLAKLG